MLRLNLTPVSINKPKLFKIPLINRSSVVNFFKEAYQLEDRDPSSPQPAGMKNPDEKEINFPSVGRRAN
jgi:hypothetical protein